MDASLAPIPQPSLHACFLPCDSALPHVKGAERISSAPWIWAEPCDLLRPIERGRIDRTAVLSLGLKRPCGFLLARLAGWSQEEAEKHPEQS